MPTRYLTALALVLTLLHCSGPATAVPLADLDYVEIKDHTGWVLRLHGDGGGTLSHKQLPTHHLHYPLGAFTPEPARGLVKRCGASSATPTCVRLAYYASRLNKLRVCECAPGEWASETMAQAIRDMQLAVDAGGNEHSCRALRRRWLASR